MGAERPAQTTAEETTVDKFKPDSWAVFGTAVLLGLIIGGFAAWATATLGVAPWAFLIGFAGGTVYLDKKHIPSEAAGSGLYITALLMILTPILFYLPNIVGAEEAETAEEIGLAVGSVLGLVIWGFVFFLLAIVTGGIGYAFKRRAENKLEGE